MPDTPQRLQLTVGLSLDAPREARQSLDRYREHIEESLFDDLRILASELVTNGVRHSGRPQGDPIALTVSPKPRLLRVDVVDGGEGVTPLRPRSQVPPSGLRYVELLSDRWGSDAAEAFHVWFEIDVVGNRRLHRQDVRQAERASSLTSSASETIAARSCNVASSESEVSRGARPITLTVPRR